MDDVGYIVKNNIIEDKNYLNEINNHLYKLLDIKNKTYNRTDNCLHHLLYYDKNLFLKILEIITNISEIKEYFKIDYIIHSFGAVINKPSKESYTHNWHIDTYEPTNENIMLNVLIPLTKFTLENGCTKIYPKNKNTYDEICLNIGDILLFNSSLTHCTGNNITSIDRNCLTITLTKIYLKPQFNYISLYSENELLYIDEKIKILLDYYSQSPNNLQDFYNKKYRLK